MRKIWLYALAAFALAWTSLAQEQPGRRGGAASEIDREILREKTRIPFERLLQLQAGRNADREEATTLSKRTADGEALVSADVLPESEVHAVINPTDSANIVVSAIRIDPATPFEILLCPVYYTLDFGQTWRKSMFKTLPNRPGALVAGGGDPVFAFDAEGKLYFSWIDLYMSGANAWMAIFWASSTDKGATWTRESNDIIARTRVSMTGYTAEIVDKQWITADQTASPWRNTVYAAFYHSTTQGPRVVVRRKSPDSAAFTQTSVPVSSGLYKFVQFTSIGIDPSGGVHVTFFGSRDSVQFALWHTLSTDGGQSFQPETKISDVNFPRYSANDTAGTIPGLLNSRLYPCPHIAIDHSPGPSRGTIYAIWTANGVSEKQANGCDIYLSASSDNGASWRAPRVLNDDTPGIAIDQFHASLAVNQRGVIAVTWYDRRGDPNNMIARYYMTLSFDGGRTFLPNSAVSTAPMDFAVAGSVNGDFAIGEYNQICMTDGYAIPFWADGRTNDGDLDIYGAFIPLAAVTSTERVSSIAEGFRLDDNYPNPFNPSTTITYAIDRPAQVRLIVHDAIGRPVRTLVDKRESAGAHRVSFDASPLPSGTYSYSLITDLGRMTKRMTLMK